MSEDGPNIVNLFRQARRICEQMASLIQTADQQMKEANWEADRGTTVTSDGSSSVLNPRQWIPVNVFMCYTNEKDFPSRLACISILFSDHFDDRYKITEPIVTGLYFDYGKKGEKFDWEYEYWYARYFGFLSASKQLLANGEPIEFDNTQLEPDLKINFEKGVTFAVPLVSLKNEKDVKKYVTDPLLKLLIK